MYPDTAMLEAVSRIGSVFLGIVCAIDYPRASAAMLQLKKWGDAMRVHRP